MEMVMVVFGAVTAWAVAASVVVIRRDGYRRVPTRHDG
jgi:hypothetical protein